MFPNVMIKDPVFDSIFGIEIISIHATGRTEKFILISSVWLVFCLTNAFEAKIIALMTSYPHAPSPRDLEDLQRMDLKIRRPQNLSLFFFTDPNLRSLLEEVPMQDMSKGENFALLGDEEEIDVLMNNMNHYDNEAKRSRFVKLDNFQIGIAIRQLRVKPRSLLAHHFVRMDRIFFETGIRQYWNNIVKHCYRLGGSHDGIMLFPDEESEELKLHDLAPAWYAIVVGSAGCTLVCLGECLWARIRLMLKCMGPHNLVSKSKILPSRRRRIRFTAWSRNFSGRKISRFPGRKVLLCLPHNLGTLALVWHRKLSITNGGGATKNCELRARIKLQMRKRRKVGRLFKVIPSCVHKKHVCI